jgi:virulence factor Mce-like protein
MSGSLQRGTAFAAAFVLLVALGATVLRPAGQYRVTAYFTQTVGLYPGSGVSILGIDVGDITEITALGDRVRVEMLIDDDYDIPADAQAVVLAPSLVSDRYVQFSPTYDGGPTMEDGDEVPLDRTATPVELDQVYGALDELSTALGPSGANQNGALSDLVDVGAANLDGNGEALNRTLTGFSQAVETLATNRETSSPPSTTCRPSPRPSRRSTRRSDSSTTTWRRSRTCWPGSGRTSPPRCSCCPRLSPMWPGSSRTTPRCCRRT